MSRKNSGYIVTIKETSAQGRTFHRKGTVNGKIPVYPLDTVLDEKGEVKLKEGEEPQEIKLYSREHLSADGMID